MDKSITLIGWVQGVFSIFFGAWWSLFANIVFTTPEIPERTSAILKIMGFSNLSISQLKLFSMLFMALYIGVFIYRIIEYMWNLSLEGQLTFDVKELWKVSKRFWRVVGYFVIFIFTIAYIFNVNSFYYFHGIALLIVWLIVSAFVIAFLIPEKGRI